MDRYDLLQATYWAFVLATCTVAWRRGEWPEQAGAAIIFLGSLGTVLAVRIDRLNIGSAQLGVLLVDLLALAGLLALVVRTNRFWPLWVCAFDLVGIATHIVTLFYPTILPTPYRLVRGFWAYPMMIAIMMGSLYPWRMRRTSSKA
ncbi:MAG TPA: hypothetical protein VEZ48_10000 [Sphingomonadaceae bacterium]|nr:hypothetical protein [Sphingomonadaceae bacterium]